MSFDVFLCHNSQDKPEVKEIALKLQEQGLKPWLDEWQLQPGLSWQELLEEQIEQIKSAAVFVGASGFGPWQKREMRAFLSEFVERNCPVIPVLLENAPQKPVLPIFLKAMTWVDFRQSEPDPMARLIWGITGIKPETEENHREEIEPAVEDKFRQEIEDKFYKDYAENRQIDPRTLDTIKELDKRMPQPIGEKEVLRIAEEVLSNCQKYEKYIKDYEEFLEEQFSNKEYKIDEETRQQLCDRRVALGLEEETVALLYNRLGEKLYSQSQLEEAISVFLEALSIMESAETYLNLGLAYYKQGLQETAILNLKQAQALFEEQEQNKEAQEIAHFLNQFL